jgi:ATP-dependent helicase/nuclease subunit A
MTAPAPTAEQRRAIELRDHAVFCEAGAGTGKTRVLVDRYCDAISEDGIEVDRILAFTFTERAAAELRTRIRRDLAARARNAREAGERDLAEALAHAARATERAWVMTMHAFCRRLLAAHPLAAGLDPRFRVLDEAEAARLRDRAVTEALDGLLAADDEEVAKAAAAYQPWRLGLMAVNAHERLRSQGMAEPRLPEVSDPCHSPRSKEDPRELTPAEVEAARRARAALERLLEAFHGRYEALKEARSALDFADLELRALVLLRSRDEIGAEWRGRFEHVMVDEFQDTNRVQLQLVEALRGPETRLFRVGDEHQSIYRFRNADLQVFRSERQRAHADPEAEVLPLRGNFRSLPGVLAAVNEVGDTLLDGFGRLTAAREAERADDGPRAELLLTLDEGRARDARKWASEDIDLEPPPSGSPPAVVAEARFLANRLRDLVDAGANRNEIVVLLRAFTHVDAYDEALRRAGLQPFIVGGRGYWTQQQVEDLVRLLGVVSNPLDDELLFGALACFANGVSPDALWMLRRAAGSGRHIWPLVEWRFGDGEGVREPEEIDTSWLDEIDAQDADRLRRFCRLLKDLRAEAPLLTLEALVDRTMSAFGYDLGLLRRNGGDGRMANVRKLMRLARDYERGEGRNLRGFLALAAESTRRGEREGMAAVHAEGHDGVRVMTVHAAKGLQFPIVAVPDLGRALNAGHRWDDIVLGRPDAHGNGAGRFGMRLSFPSAESFGLWELVSLNEEESQAEAEEGCRLVYVAASRAQNRLILSGVYKPADLDRAEEAKPNDTPLCRLLPALVERGWAGGAGRIALPAPEPAVSGEPEPASEPLEVRVSEPSPERAAELIRSRPAPIDADPLKDTSGPPPLLESRPSPVPVGHLSYSALAQYERCGYRFYVERVLGVREAMQAATRPGERDENDAEEPDREGDELPEPPDPRLASLGLGRAVHALLEWSARRGWEAPSADLIAAMLGREGLADDATMNERAARLVSGWLEAPLRADLGETGLRPELPFVLPLGSTVVRGKIDLLAPPNGAPATVVDFKTDPLRGRDPAELGERYRAQREVYALAAAGAERREVRAVHVFLEAPDRPVVDDFDPPALDAARARLEELLEAMADAAFSPTDQPTAAICYGCPAAARLCPHPAWRPSG